jgi:hypothetical protein
VPWKKLCTLIEPHYPKAGNGRPPVGVERMLRMVCKFTGGKWKYPSCSLRRYF